MNYCMHNIIIVHNDTRLHSSTCTKMQYIHTRVGALARATALFHHHYRNKARIVSKSEGEDSANALCNFDAKHLSSNNSLN